MRAQSQAAVVQLCQQSLETIVILISISIFIPYRSFYVYSYQVNVTSITSAGSSGVWLLARGTRATFITAIIHKYIPIGQFIGLNFLSSVDITFICAMRWLAIID